MPRRLSDQERPHLVVSLDEAKRKIGEQINKTNDIPNVSINKNDEAKRWYEFTSELLRQIFTTDELSDEYTGRSGFSIGNDDISVGAYVKKLASIYERLELYPEENPEPLSLGATDLRAVFVVYGRNIDARDGMYDLISALDLKPIPFEEAVKWTGSASPFIGDVIEVAFEHVQAVVILLTPDENVQLREEFRVPTDNEWDRVIVMQPRPNVLFEAGMAFAKHKERTVIVQIGKVRPFSDSMGRHVIFVNDDPSWRHQLSERLRTAGCQVSLQGERWLKSGKYGLEDNSALSNTV